VGIKKKNESQTRRERKEIKANGKGSKEQIRG